MSPASPAVAGPSVAPAADPVNSDSSLFRVTRPGLPPLDLTHQQAADLARLIAQHDKPARELRLNGTRRTAYPRGPLARSIQSILNEDGRTVALNTARYVAKHARRAGIIT